MKKLFTLLGVLAAPLGLWADSKIQMVTYFPVPYVAYSKVNATDQMDIGLTTSCIMNLGCTESGNAGLRPLNVTNTILNKGKLELNTAAAVSGSAASIGSGSGSGSMNFNSNLRVNTLNDGVSVEANNITVDTLKLFPNRITTDFPSCASTGAPGTPNISWQKLKLKDKEEVYLMCGNAKEAEPEDPCEDYTYKVGHKSECCPSASQSDSVCYTSCPASYKWQPYKDYTFGVYDGHEYIIGTSALSQSWFGAADWVEKACRQGEFYRTTQGPITCNSAVTSTWCWNPLALNPNFKVVFRAAEHSVNIGQPDTFLGTCSSVGARALLLWGSTHTGYFAKEIMCQFNAHAYNLYANAYYYECINENSGKLCKNGW